MTKIDLLKRSAALAATFAFAFGAVGSPAFAKPATNHVDKGIEAADTDADEQVDDGDVDAADAADDADDAADDAADAADEAADAADDAADDNNDDG